MTRWLILGSDLSSQWHIRPVLIGNQTSNNAVHTGKVLWKWQYKVGSDDKVLYRVCMTLTLGLQPPSYRFSSLGACQAYLQPPGKKASKLFQYQDQRRARDLTFLRRSYLHFAC